MKTKFKKLPVYDWCDDHDEAEWIAIGADGQLWHRIGGHCHSIPEETQEDLRKNMKGGFTCSSQPKQASKTK